MYYFLLFLAVIGITATFSMGKVYQLKTEATFGVILRKTLPMALLAALMFWLMSGCSVTFSGFTVLMSCIMTVIAVLSAVVCFVGYASGSIAVFTLFQMIGGMLLPFIYGIWFGNKVSVCQWIGIVLLLISVFFPLLADRKSSSDKARLSPRFILCCVAIFFINGSISIVSYIHSNSALASGTYSFLVLKSLILAAACVVLLLIWHFFVPAGKQEGWLSPVSPKTRWLLILLLVGMTVADGLGYYLQLISAAELPAVALYPIVTGGTTVMTALAGLVFFREKLNRMSTVGIVLAFCATVLFVF